MSPEVSCSLIGENIRRYSVMLSDVNEREIDSHEVIVEFAKFGVEFEKGICIK
jgi:hypothetical protein